MQIPKYCLLIGIMLFFCFILFPETTVEIKKGDTLYSISRKYNVSVDTLLNYNNLSDPSKIRIGTKIKLPLTYKMVKGDTVYKVSRLFDVSVEDICKYNKIEDISSIKIGTILLIPGGRELQKQPDITDSEIKEIIWPHPGKREKLNDILKGVAIEGLPGDYVYSISQGKVIWADPFRGYGKMVMVMGLDNYIYVYAGNEELLVKVGDEVYLNSKIGILGKNAHDGKSKAYFFIYKDGKAMAPDFRP